jgi:hypothetical protein
VGFLIFDIRMVKLEARSENQPFVFDEPAAKPQAKYQYLSAKRRPLYSVICLIL